MSTDRGRRPPPRVRTRPNGSSQRAVAIALAVLGVSIFLAAFFLVLDRIRDEDNDPNVAIVATSTATVALPDPAQATGNATPQGTSPAPASSTMPPNPTSELVPSSPSPAPTATVAESEPTVTPVPEEPTATPEIPIDEPTQGEEPFAGDFGDLPPAILPSGGVSQSLRLNYELGMSLTALPASSWVYLLEWPLYSLDEVAAIAQQLGLFADVVEQGVGVYRVSADSGTLFVSPAEIVFAGAGFDTSGELLDDASALDVAAAWLATSSFAGANADGGSVVSRDDELGRIVVVFRPVEPAPNLAPTPSATLTIGPGGAVLEARIHWPSNLIASEYGLRAPNELWQLMIGGYGVLDADISGLSATGPLTGTANITDYTIAYTLAGSPANQQYLVPLLVFLGSATIDQTGEVIPVEIAVPSVYHQAGPLG